MPKDIDIDLERCMTASTKQSNSCQPSFSSENGINCAVAVQNLDGRAVLINAIIKEEVNGDLVFSSAKKQIFQAITKSWHQRLVGNLFMGLVVGTAKVKQVNQTSSSRQFVFPMAHTLNVRLYTAHHDHIHPNIKGRHHESIFRISPSTLYSQKHSTALTSSSIRQLTL